VEGDLGAAAACDGKCLYVDSVGPVLLWLDDSPAAKTRTVVRLELEIWIY
jgi:hypothetical protein